MNCPALDYVLKCKDCCQCEITFIYNVGNKPGCIGHFQFFKPKFLGDCIIWKEVYEMKLYQS